MKCSKNSFSATVAMFTLDVDEFLSECREYFQKMKQSWRFAEMFAKFACLTCKPKNVFTFTKTIAAIKHVIACKFFKEMVRSSDSSRRIAKKSFRNRRANATQAQVPGGGLPAAAADRPRRRRPAAGWGCWARAARARL